jgi:hypothetical protein
MTFSFGVSSSATTSTLFRFPFPALPGLAGDTGAGAPVDPSGAGVLGLLIRAGVGFRTPVEVLAFPSSDVFGEPTPGRR